MKLLPTLGLLAAAAMAGLAPAQAQTAAAGDTLEIRRWGDRQDAVDRLAPIDIAVIVDEGDHRRNGRSSSAWAKYADAPSTGSGQACAGFR